MFCTECGQKARGKFCSHCGHSLLEASEDGTTPSFEHDKPAVKSDEVLVEIVGGWDDEVRYETLLKVPEVRTQIERHKGMAKQGITGEQVLALYDKVVSSPIPLEKVAGLIQPFYAKLGINTGKQRVVRIDAPVGRVMVRALCSLARHNQAVRKVSQGTDGCFFEAVLPSDVLALEGDLLVTVRRQGRGAEVTAATKIAGQWFDFGKSNRCLDKLVNDLQVDPG